MVRNTLSNHRGDVRNTPMNNLLLGLHKCAGQQDENFSRAAGWEFIGLYFYLDSIKCWTGVYYSKPQIVVVEAHDISNAATEAVAFGRAERSAKNTFRWINKLDLDSEEVHFFTLTPESQQARLHGFISDSTAALKKIGLTS
jgi:hypothetical protein